MFEKTSCFYLGIIREYLSKFSDKAFSNKQQQQQRRRQQQQRQQHYGLNKVVCIVGLLTKHTTTQV